MVYWLHRQKEDQIPEDLVGTRRMSILREMNMRRREGENGGVSKTRTSIKSTEDV